MTGDVRPIPATNDGNDRSARPSRERRTTTRGQRFSDSAIHDSVRHDGVGCKSSPPVAGVSSAPPIVVFSSSRARAMASAELAPLLDADGEGRGVSRGRSLGRVRVRHWRLSLLLHGVRAKYEVGPTRWRGVSVACRV